MKKITLTNLKLFVCSEICSNSRESMCIIIAEIGENHLGSMRIAKRLIDLSKSAGADYVKFQYYNANDCAENDPEKDWFQKVQLDLDKIKYLLDYSKKSNIGFLCTPWDTKKAEELFSLRIRDVKIASFHIADKDMLRVIARKARKVFLSTGMSSLSEIDTAVKLLKNTDLFVLHCISEYPADEKSINLKVMDLLRKRYRCKVGYSDHTTSLLAPLAAVARGAEVIEKHITLSKSFEGTDHILSADPKELKFLVSLTHRINNVLGDGRKMMTSKEKQNQKFMRNRFRLGK